MKLVPITLAFVLLLTTTTVQAATTADCTDKTGIAKVRCERIQRRSKALKSGTTRAYINRNTDVLQKVRYNRRSDRQDRYGTSRSDERKSVLGVENLKNRRQTALQRRNARLTDRNARNAQVLQSRSQLLRDRINSQANSAIRSRVIDKFQLRTNSRALDENVQDRRAAVKRAHEKCREIRGTERLQCLRDARAIGLDDSE